MSASVNESILLSVKKLLNVAEFDTNFDSDLILYINSALMVVWQIGIGQKGFKITGETETWEDLLGDDTHLELVKTYVALKVRIAFDPPQSSFVLESVNKLITEYEYRLNVQAEFSGNIE
jgi:hypothetical protein